MIYRKDFSRFQKTGLPFRWFYRGGEVPDYGTAHYYCICPKEPNIPDFVKAQYDDDRTEPTRLDLASLLSDPDAFFSRGLSYLVEDKTQRGYRYWSGPVSDYFTHDHKENWYASREDGAAYRDMMEFAILDKKRTYTDAMDFLRLVYGLDFHSRKPSE